MVALACQHNFLTCAYPTRLSERELRYITIRVRIKRDQRIGELIEKGRFRCREELNSNLIRALTIETTLAVRDLDIEPGFEFVHACITLINTGINAGNTSFDGHQQTIRRVDLLTFLKPGIDGEHRQTADYQPQPL